MHNKYGWMEAERRERQRGKVGDELSYLGKQVDHILQNVSKKASRQKSHMPLLSQIKYSREYHKMCVHI